MTALDSPHLVEPDDPEAGRLAAWGIRRLGHSLGQVAFPADAADVLLQFDPLLDALEDAFLVARDNFQASDTPEDQRTAADFAGAAQAAMTLRSDLQQLTTRLQARASSAPAGPAPVGRRRSAAQASSPAGPVIGPGSAPGASLAMSTLTAEAHLLRGLR